MNVNQLYTAPSKAYASSPMSFSNVPDLMSSYDDISTEPSPSPPVIFASLDNQYQRQTAHSAYSDYLQRQHPPSPIANVIEFTDLTKFQTEDLHHRRRRSTTAQDKEAASNMRIRRRAQNRASQRAFRERKEKHVQHLEHELELLEDKHQSLANSYTKVDASHAKLQREVEELREELARWRAGNGSRENSVTGTPTQMTMAMKMEDDASQRGNSLFDPFAADEFFGCAAAQGSF